MQEQNTGQEVPDKFFLNEVKREVADIVNSGLSDQVKEIQDLGEFVDVHELQRVIKDGDAHPGDAAAIAQKNPAIIDGMWEYLNSRYEEVFTRKGYASDDLRGGVVALCSAYTKLSRSVDAVKVTAIGEGARTDFMNSMLSGIAMGAARGMIIRNGGLLTPGTSGFVSRLSDEAFKKTGYESGHTSWGWAKVHTTAEVLRSAFTFREILDGLPEIGMADAEMLKRQNDEMVGASAALRTFTPKPAVGELEGTNLSTLFISKDVGDHFVLGQEGAYTNHIKVFNDTDLDSSNVTLDYARSYKNHGGLSKRVRPEGTDSSASHADIVMYNGDTTVLGVKMSDLAQEMGMEGQGELLRSMILAQNFDLTVPAYVVGLTNEEAGNEEVHPESNPIVDKMRRLLIARVRALKLLGDGIAEELSNEQQEVNVNHKAIAKHGVVGHLRRLPNGYNASADAKRLCREQLGVEIPDGHTYVQIHERGDLDVPNRGHKIDAVRQAGRVSMGKKQK